MEIRLKNVGRLKKAEISLQSITVIAGENGSGKSTIGKTLFSCFNALSNAEDKIKLLRQEMLRRELSRNQELFSFEFPSRFAENLLNVLQGQEKTKEEIECILRDLFFEEKDDFIITSELVERIEEILSIQDDRFLRRLVNLSFEHEFSGQISSVYNDLNAQIDLKIQNNIISISFDKTQNCDKIKNPLVLRKAIYFDNPFVLDEANKKRFFFRRSGIVEHHNIVLRDLILEEQKDVVGEILNEEKYIQLKKKIQATSGGKITKGASRFFYIEDGRTERIEISNLATGLKTFLILQTLIENGHILEKDVLILDEPEVHLHPKWQIAFAEIIVLLQNTFDLHILINTHSPLSLIHI